MYWLCSEFIKLIKPLTGGKDLTLSIRDDDELSAFVYQLRWFIDDYAKSVTVRLFRSEILEIMERGYGIDPENIARTTPDNTEEYLMRYLVDSFTKKINEFKKGEINNV